MTDQKPSVREELASALRVSHPEPCNKTHCRTCRALSRDIVEPDDRPLLLALLKAARAWGRARQDDDYGYVQPLLGSIAACSSIEVSP